MKIHACSLTVALAFTALPSFGQVTTIRHPLFPAPGEEGSTPLVPCTLPDQFVPRSLWNANLWPGGIVHYAIDPAVTADNRARLFTAMSELEMHANIQFVPRTTQSAYIYVQNSTVNNSFVGRTGGRQVVNLVSWTSRYTIIHELMHALGVWHEQQRSDRGQYVSIVTSNIQSGQASNFAIRTDSSPFGPFDFESVMLYDDCAFSICCPTGTSCGCALSCATIVAQPAYAEQQQLMGNLGYLSQGDRDGLANRYGPVFEDAYEDNDTALTAVPIPIRTPVSLKLYDTEDYFAFPVSVAGVVSVEFRSGVWSTSNASVWLISPAGFVLRSGQPADPDGDGVFVANVSATGPSGMYKVRVTRNQVWGGRYTLQVDGTCDDIDFNNNGVFPEDQDITDFFLVLAGGVCASCNDIDFNNNLVYPEDADIVEFFDVLAGGTCPQ